MVGSGGNSGGGGGGASRNGPHHHHPSNAGGGGGGGAHPANSINAYLSPPQDGSWRRHNSDSALHDRVGENGLVNHATQVTEILKILLLLLLLSSLLKFSEAICCHCFANFVLVTRYCFRF